MTANVPVYLLSHESRGMLLFDEQEPSRFLFLLFVVGGMWVQQFAFSLNINRVKHN